MADSDKGPNKSAFLRELFKKNPALTEAEANEAWQKAGNEGDIGTSSYYNVKRESKGEPGATPAAPKKAGAKAATKGPKVERAGQSVESHAESSGKAAPKPAVSKSGAGERERVLERVEDEIDDLMGELKELGGMEAGLEALKKLRRVVVRSHEG